jgi:hypothetical protein
MVARGIMLGPNTPVVLHLLDIEPAAQALQGVKMELLDAAFPLLQGAWATPAAELFASHAVSTAWIWLCCPPPLLTSPAVPFPSTLSAPASCTGVVASTNVEEACKGVDVAVMLGGFPRKAGMERKDVMSKNVSIYAAQAAALEKHANKGVKVRWFECGVLTRQHHTPVGTLQGGACVPRRHRQGRTAVTDQPKASLHRVSLLRSRQLPPPPRGPAPLSNPCKTLDPILSRLPRPSHVMTGAGGCKPRQHQRADAQGARTLYPS